MDDKKILQFIEWIGANVPELKGQTPDQIMSTINKLASTQEGQQMLEGLVQEFESSSSEMFKKGGKLNYLLCLKSGGSTPGCNCGKQVKKAESGFKLNSEQYQHASKRDMFTSAQDQLGWDKNKTREAYRLQKDALRNQGYSGNELRQRARYKVIDRAYPRAEDPNAVVETPAVTLPNWMESEQTPLNFDYINAQWNRPELPEFVDVTEEAVEEEALPQTRYFRGEFNDAFAKARKAGLSDFVWDDSRAKYGSYGTGLKPEESSEQSGGYIQEGEATSTYPQYIATPVTKENGKTGYRFGDLLRMATVNNAYLM